MILAETVAIDIALIVMGLGVFVTIGVGLFSWALVTVVRLTGIVSVLEEKVRQLASDIDDLVAGSPEIRRRPTHRSG